MTLYMITEMVASWYTMYVSASPSALPMFTLMARPTFIECLYKYTFDILEHEAYGYAQEETHQQPNLILRNSDHLTQLGEYHKWYFR
jgi:hypothetical protein